MVATFASITCGSPGGRMTSIFVGSSPKLATAVNSAFGVTLRLSARMELRSKPQAAVNSGTLAAVQGIRSRPLARFLWFTTAGSVMRQCNRACRTSGLAVIREESCWVTLSPPNGLGPRIQRTTSVGWSVLLGSTRSEAQPNPVSPPISQGFRHFLRAPGAS